MPVPWLVPAIITAVSSIASGIQQHRQNKQNRELAKFQADADSKFLDKQNAYNTPASQMQRFQDAGLNPNLIYGQGNPGNQATAQQYPKIESSRIPSLAEGLPLYNQTRMVDAQVQAQNANTIRTGVLTDLAKVQKEVLEKNPLLDAGGFNAIIESLKASASMKTSDSAIRKEYADWYTGEKSMQVQDKDGNYVPIDAPAGVHMLQKQLELLDQRFRLGTLDSKVKAEIINGKEFQNALLEVQKQWMTNADITPQHIYQFIMMLLMKIK